MDRQLAQQLSELRERSRSEPKFNAAQFLADRIRTGDLKIPAADQGQFVSHFVRLWRYGAFGTPELVLDTTALLLTGRTVDVTCDPWAEFGVLAAKVRRTTKAKVTYAISMNPED